MATLPKGTPDRRVWQHASRKRLVLVTADEDFWDDRRYQLHTSPGLLLLHGRDAGERLAAFATVLNAWDLPATYRRRPDALFGTKTRGSDERVFTKLLARDGSVVEWEHEL